MKERPNTSFATHIKPSLSGHGVIHCCTTKQQKAILLVVQSFWILTRKKGIKYNSCYPVGFLLCLQSKTVHYFWKAAVDTASSLSFILSWEYSTGPRALRSVTVAVWCEKNEREREREGEGEGEENNRRAVGQSASDTSNGRLPITTQCNSALLADSAEPSLIKYASSSHGPAPRTASRRVG